MSDTLANALRGGSVLDQIANPVVANPLAGIAAASQAAESTWRNRLSQAQQAAGQAAQAATDASGNLDIPGYQRNLAAAGPGAALAVPSELSRAQTIATAQQEQMIKSGGLMAGMAAPLLATGKPISKQQWVDTMMRGVGSHMFTADQINQAAQDIPEATADDPYAVNRWLRGHVVAFISPEQRAALGKPGTAMGPDGVEVGTMQDPYTGVYTSPQQPGMQGRGVQTGPDANTLAGGQEVVIQVPSADGKSTVPMKVWVPRTSLPGLPSVPPAPGPAPTGGGAGGGPAASPAPTGGGGTGGGGTKAPPPPLPKPGDPPIPAGYVDSRGKGATTAPAPQPTPAPPPAGGPQPAATPQTPTSPVIQTPLGPVVPTGAPAGQEARIEAGNKIYTQAATDYPAQQKRAIAGESALEALKLAATGPGTGWFANVKAFIRARGEDPSAADSMSPEAARQYLQKQLLRFAQDSAKSSGTDLGLETMIHSNANVDTMLNSANRHTLIQDMGILRRDMVMNKQMPQGEAAIEHVKNFQADTDPRGFAFDLMTPGERRAVINDVDAQDKRLDPSGKTHPNRDKLNKSIQLGIDAGHVHP